MRSIMADKKLPKTITYDDSKNVKKGGGTMTREQYKAMRDKERRSLTK